VFVDSCGTHSFELELAFVCYHAAGFAVEELADELASIAKDY